MDIEHMATIQEILLDRKEQIEVTQRVYAIDSFPQSHEQWEIKLANIDAALTALQAAQGLEHRVKGMTKELQETEQILGSALGYPRYCDDLVNFPGSTEADGVCIGPHTAATLAMEAADKLKSQAGECWTPVDVVPSADKPWHLYQEAGGFSVCDDDGAYLMQFNARNPSEYAICKRTTPRPNTQSLLSHARTSTKLQVTQTYALALHNQSAVDWKAVNEAIINRWNMTTLKRIKDWAWEAYRHEQKAQKEQ